MWMGNSFERIGWSGTGLERLNMPAHFFKFTLAKSFHFFLLFLAGESKATRIFLFSFFLFLLFLRMDIYGQS